MSKSIIKIFFDGGCPICSREIRFYRWKASADGFQWLDVSNLSEGIIPRGYSREELLKRFHVEHFEEGVVSGALAFALLWQEVFGWRWVVRVVKLPVVRETCDLGYSLFRRIRQVFIRRTFCNLDT